jgi:hypothetical protein
MYLELEGLKESNSSHAIASLNPQPSIAPTRSVKPGQKFVGNIITSVPSQIICRHMTFMAPAVSLSIGGEASPIQTGSSTPRLLPFRRNDVADIVSERLAQASAIIESQEYGALRRAECCRIVFYKVGLILIAFCSVDCPIFNTCVDE